MFFTTYILGPIALLTDCKKFFLRILYGFYFGNANRPLQLLQLLSKAIPLIQVLGKDYRPSVLFMRSQKHLDKVS